MNAAKEKRRGLLEKLPEGVVTQEEVEKRQQMDCRIAWSPEATGDIEVGCCARDRCARHGINRGSPTK